MSDHDQEPRIPNSIIKQVYLLLVITLAVVTIIWQLSDFIPALLGAVTLYIVCRPLNFYFIEKKKWRRWQAAGLILFICALVTLLPTYLIGKMLMVKLLESEKLVAGLQDFILKIQNYILEQTGFDILSKANLTKGMNYLTGLSTQVLNAGMNVLATLAAMFFILYFMLISNRSLEKNLNLLVPFKRKNNFRLGEVLRRMVVANAVGIPVVAFGQAVIALIGYFIFNAPSPMLLFALTFVGSMLPVVGAAIIFVPVGIYMLATGDQFGGVGVLLYGTLVVGLVDNVLRMTVLRKLDDIHPLNTIFGIILGLNLFGFIGLIFGPILVSVTGFLFRVYNDEFEDIEDENAENSPLIKEI